MPELRKDPFSHRWVIIAPEHAPGAYHLGSGSDDPIFNRGPAACSLCPGNEVHTPPEVYSLRPREGTASGPNAPGWSLRVVPHKFPVLRVEGALSEQAHGVYDRMNGIGAHEVVVETPDHARQLCDLSPAEIEQVLWAFRQRILDLRRDLRFRYISVFKAHGQRAGANFGHSHSQIIASPFIPQGILDELSALRAHHEARRRCLLCDIGRQETEEGQRVILDNGTYVVLAPYASRTPFETFIMPLVHTPAFEDAQATYGPLSSALRITLRKLRAALDNPAFILNLHNAPFDEGRPLPGENPFFHRPTYHFHIEIRPVLGRSIPIPWGSGSYVNPTPPEEAAHYLRELEA
jgi:UDPglucose--hexose-1-phosphate uridylyltransferase